MQLQASIKSIKDDYAKNIVNKMFSFGDSLLFKYADGFINEYVEKEFVSKPAGYPNELVVGKIWFP